MLLSKICVTILSLEPIFWGVSPQAPYQKQIQSKDVSIHHLTRFKYVWSRSRQTTKWLYLLIDWQCFSRHLETFSYFMSNISSFLLLVLSPFTDHPACSLPLSPFRKKRIQTLPKRLWMISSQMIRMIKPQAVSAVLLHPLSALRDFHSISCPWTKIWNIVFGLGM